jgi:predicted Zn-ribbon and HTH transcriptional regulator
MKTKSPPIPREESSTVRQSIIALLERETLSARELSSLVHVGEKEVIDHLEHIRTASRHEKPHLKVVPAVCKRCGFSFKKRERLAKPGKCPVCRNEQIVEPLYTLR